MPRRIQAKDGRELPQLGHEDMAGNVEVWCKSSQGRLPEHGYRGFVLGLLSTQWRYSRECLTELMLGRCRIKLGQLTRAHSNPDNKGAGPVSRCNRRR